MPKLSDLAEGTKEESDPSFLVKNATPTLRMLFLKGFEEFTELSPKTKSKNVQDDDKVQNGNYDKIREAPLLLSFLARN